MPHFVHGYVTCLYVPFYLVGYARAQIVTILLVYVSILAHCSALFIFKNHMLAFVDLIHALPTRGGSTQFMFPGGVLHQRKKNWDKCICTGGACIHAFGSSFIQEEHAFMHLGTLFRINFSCALLPMVSSPFCLTMVRWQFLEHFISVVSSHCPRHRGPGFFSLKWCFLDFCLAFDHLFEFSFISFPFIFSLNWLLVCVVYALIKGEIEDRSIWGPECPRTGGWSLLAVTSDWQHGVDWLLAEYCRCRLRLDLRWCRWSVGTKCLCLAGPPRSGETSRSDSRDTVDSGVKCGLHGGKKSKTESLIGAGVG
jgi:hypothetical protein